MELTPGMKQYMEIKDKHPDCIVLFRMGDFYETFYEDAKTVAKELEIVLTSRGKGEKKAPLAGIPYHALDPYLGKLIKKGYKVCIVEQLEDPKLAKGLVKRGVVRIVTPGTIIEDNILSKDSNNFIMSINREQEKFGVAFADISTGEFLTAEIKDDQRLFSEIDKFSPAEIIIPTSLQESSMYKQIKAKGLHAQTYDDRFFWIDKSKKTILDHFNIANLEGFGISDKELAISASGALLSYLKETQMNTLAHISKIQNYSIDNFMIIDGSTQKNLELLRNIRDGTTRGTLFNVINKTVTSLGTRKLKKWLLRPLLDIKKINKRLDSVQELKDNAILQEDIKEVLCKFSDIERISARIIYGTANAKDLVALKNSLILIPEIKKLMNECKSEFLIDIKQMNELKNVHELIDSAIKDDPAVSVREGNMIKKGYNTELDEIREIASGGRKWITELEESEREKTGIKNLKIRYNRIFGYFIEVTKSHLNLVPDNYIRKQTQANSERYFTEELKTKENLILSSQDKIFNLEYDIFINVIEDIKKDIVIMQDIADKISSLDCLVSLSIVANENNYNKPLLHNLSEIKIIAGRHPVVETIEESFVDNNCNLDIKTRIKIISGPNMSGKSTYLRQTALIVLLAQIGSYVPADSAFIGTVDRIFTRVGASDDLASGQSTFMVEMNETANILNNATEKSLVILDEIGRGTSTYDGFSLAWAIAEFIATKINALTLFATHYHQLNKMAEEFDNIKNYNIAVDESGDEIVFLRKIVAGGTDKSYGIHVAKLAGIPDEVISRAKILMEILEAEDKIMKKLESQVISQKKLASEDFRKKFERKEKSGKISMQNTLLDIQ